jgi:hypothetical protein
LPGEEELRTLAAQINSTKSYAINYSNGYKFGFNNCLKRVINKIKEE